MKIYGMRNYSELYNMLKRLDCKFTLIMPNGDNFNGRSHDNGLCEMLLCAKPLEDGSCTLILDDYRAALQSMDYFINHHIT